MLFFWTKMVSFRLLQSQRQGKNGGFSVLHVVRMQVANPFPEKGKLNIVYCEFSIISTHLQSLACIHNFFPFLNAGLSLVAKIWIRPDFSFFALRKNDRIIYSGRKPAPYRLVHALKQYLYCSNGTCPTQDSGLNLRRGSRWSLSRRAHTGADGASNGQEGENQCRGGHKIQVFLHFPATAFSSGKKGWQPTACTWNGVCGQLRLACKGCVSEVGTVWEKFFSCSVGFCHRHLLQGPAEHVPLLVLSIGAADAQGQKGTQNPRPMTVHTQNPKGASGCTPGASLSPLGRKNTNWCLRSRKMYEPPMQDTARYVIRCSQQPQGSWIFVQCPPSVASRGSKLLRLVMYPVKINSFNQ